MHKILVLPGVDEEDYFCGSYNFENHDTHLYQTFSTPYTGLAQVLPPAQIYQPGQQLGLYRWHIADPIRFKKDLKVTIQALGWKKRRPIQTARRRNVLRRLLVSKEPRQDFPPLPGRDERGWY